MGFREHLQQVCLDVEGAVACTLMANDGIEVDSHVAAENAGVDVRSLLVECSALMRSAKEAAETHEAGGLSEFSFSTDKLTAVARPVSPEYFLVVALRPEANQGKARWLLRMAAPKVRAEL
jgi:predicted regulator of Ras-like GTPase activity (Roadblock/LC7/MglB family)